MKRPRPPDLIMFIIALFGSGLVTYAIRHHEWDLLGFVGFWGLITGLDRAAALIERSVKGSNQ